MARGKKRGGTSKSTRGRPPTRRSKKVDEVSPEEGENNDTQDSQPIDTSAPLDDPSFDNKNSVVVLKRLHKKFDRFRYVSNEGQRLMNERRNSIEISEDLSSNPTIEYNITSEQIHIENPEADSTESNLVSCNDNKNIISNKEIAKNKLIVNESIKNNVLGEDTNTLANKMTDKNIIVDEIIEQTIVSNEISRNSDVSEEIVENIIYNEISEQCDDGNESDSLGYQVVEEVLVTNKNPLCHKNTEKMTLSDNVYAKYILSNEFRARSRSSDDDSNSVDNALLNGEEVNIGSLEEIVDIQEETTVVFEIIEDCDEDSLTSSDVFEENNTEIMTVEELSCQDHPEVVSYEVEIEETIIATVEEKMVVDSSIFEQHECNLHSELEKEDIDYSDNSSSDIDESSSGVCFDIVKHSCQSIDEQHSKTTDSIKSINDKVDSKLLNCWKVKLNLNDDDEKESFDESIDDGVDMNESFGENIDNENEENLDTSLNEADNSDIALNDDLVKTKGASYELVDSNRGYGEINKKNSTSSNSSCESSEKMTTGSIISSVSSSDLSTETTENNFSASTEIKVKIVEPSISIDLSDLNLKISETSISCASNETNLKPSEVALSDEQQSLEIMDNTSEEVSPLIRRSNRIKTISVLKKKSKGHGLVRNDRFKRLDQTSEKDKDKDISDSTENQNDALSIKPLSKELTSSDNSDSSDLKPVKVKSRWRRTSELEMATPSQSSNSDDSNKNSQQSSSENKSKTPEELQFEKDMEERLRQFVQLQENEYHCEKTVCREAKKMLCDCFLTPEEIARGEMGCGEDCLNRLLMIECGPNCVVGDRCTNKRFQESQYANCKVFKTEKKGFGIQATMDMTPGDFIMEYVGEVLNTEQFEKRAEEYSNDRNRHYYFMALKSDAIIDATNKGNISRFINHSCDPNAETQKWTVNGELRIGFFSKRNIKRGDEITFDYQFQRYGKEAQKCFCEASNCRGWIGEEPESDESDEVSESESESEEEPATCDSPKASEMQEEENDKVETDKDEKAVKPKPKKSTKQLTDSEDEWIQTQEPEDIEKIKASDKSPKIKKRTLGRWAGRKNKKSMVHRKDIFEDLDLDEEIQMLSRTGLKNQAHTLTLSRLMVRAKETQHRINLLSVIQGGEVPCRRLFLDYHGLRLIYSWMCDSTTNNKSSVLNDKQNEKEFINLRLEILNTLMTLPIPNKTMLQDSKVLTTVEKWSQKLDDSEKSPNSSPSDDSDASRTPILVDEATGLIIDSVKQELDSAKLESKSLNEKDKIGSISKTSPKLENDESSLDNSTDVKPKIEQIDHDNKELLNEEKFDEDAIYFTELRKKLVEVALQLLLNWKSLKEVFRIPKRERIEQMKEHEREANRGYTDPNSERKDIKKYRFKSSGKENTISTLGASGGPTQLRSVVKKLDRNNSSLSKFQRRQLFAERVAAEETEKRLRAGRELWRAHSNHCSLMGFDPLTTPAPDPSTGLPMYYDPVKEEWNTRQLDASIGMHISQMMPPQPNVMMPPQPNVMMYPNQPAYFPHPGMMMPDQFGQQQIMMPFPNFQNNVVQTLPAPEQQPVMTPTQQIQMMPPGNGPPVMIPPGPHMMTNNQTHLLAPGPVVPGQQHIMMPGQQHGMIPGGPQPMIAPGQHPVITSAQQMMPPFQQSNISMTPEQQQMMTFMMASGQNVIPQPNITAQEEFVDESVIKNSNIDKEKSHRKKNKKKDKKKKDKESVVSEKDTEKINIGAANPYKIPPPEDLPPGWLSAIDQNGRIYYYHSKKRVSQWLPPDMCKNIFGRFNQFEDSDTSDDDELKTESKLIKNIIHNNKIINSDNSDDSDSDNLEDTLLMRQVHGNILSNQSPSALTLKGLDSIRKARHEQLDKSRVVVMKAEAESTTPSDDQHSIYEMTIPLNITKPTLNSPVYKPKRVRELQPGSAAFDSLSSPVVNSDSSQVGDVTPQPDDTMNFGDDATGCDSSTLILKDKKRIKRNGLVTEILISPRSEHDRMHQKMEIKRYKENKEKLKMKKYLKMQREIMKVKGMESRHSKPQVVLPVSNPSEESSLPMMIPQALPEENLEKQQILAIKRKSSSHEQNVLHHHQKRLKAIEENKNQTLEKSKEDIPFLFTLSENSKEGLRIKEQFRVDVAKVIVSQLNHFRKPDCLIGRITNTKDFKHLAKKLTHFVMVKELKHCKSVEELTFNESVKVKAKEFVKKYMVKYGDVYVRPPQEAVD